MSRSRAVSAVGFAAMVVVSAAALSACGGDGSAGKGSRTEFVAGADGVSTVPKGERRLPNELKGDTLQGKHLDVADLEGKVVVINVWGSTCPPCRAEAPLFSKVARETRAKGVAFVGIDTRDASRTAGLAFEANHGVTYPSLYDPVGKLVLYGFPKGSLNPQTIPSTIVLDRDGKIAARALQPLSGESLHKMIDPLIGEK
ncbi:TlpA family protein disulfide reductase [Streptomyces sp. NPDC087903]|uniref:TlpA family protein disulfide reductase n=1 Tax=Streptomyces sp. NPDC087903 TaxID=3365819 RepID=UPI00380EA032